MEELLTLCKEKLQKEASAIASQYQWYSYSLLNVWEEQ